LDFKTIVPADLANNSNHAGEGRRLQEKSELEAEMVDPCFSLQAVTL